jgi:two-component system NarL family response regulator
MRLLLADGETNVRYALRALLQRQPGLQVVGEAAEWEGLLRQIAASCPEMVLLAWDLRGMAGTQGLAWLRSRCPDLKVMVLSSRPEIRAVALASGAYGFVAKTDPPEELLTALRSAAEVRVKEGASAS